MHRALITIYATLVCTNNLLTRRMDAHKGDSLFGSIVKSKKALLPITRRGAAVTGVHYN